MGAKKVKVLFNQKKEWAKELAKKVSAFLQKNGFEIVKSNADTTICIGGDGTILYYNHVGALEGSVLGIGNPRSYICQLRRDNWEKNIIEILERQKVEKRPTLAVEFDKKEYRAINDVVIHSSDYRVIPITVFIGRRKYRFEGDGMIVSSPTGSSSYAYSAGGKILKPTKKEMEVVPICPYKRRFAPLTVGWNKTVKVSSARIAALIIDGILITNIGKDWVTIKVGKPWYYLRKR